MPRVSIIIRAKNEEEWIKPCLKTLKEQSFQDFEIVLVDNKSTDRTVEIAKVHGVKTIVQIDKYIPGKAINTGIRASQGEYLVILSAHCIPENKTWLEAFVHFLDDKKNENVAGVYGKQIPVSFTPNEDKRDLILTFGEDIRIQSKDCFFHNANSMIRRSVWEEFPFDEEVTNIEDRLWAKTIQSHHKQVAYLPAASVFHHHGLHQSKSRSRADSLVSVIEKIHGEELMDSLPDSLKPENLNTIAILPIAGALVEHSKVDLLASLLTNLENEPLISKVYVLTSHDIKNIIKPYQKSEIIKRPKELDKPNKTLEDALGFALKHFEDQNIYADRILYANYQFPFRSKYFFKGLITEAALSGVETCFPALPDYGNYWKISDDKSYKAVEGGLKLREKREPMYKAIYGLGTLTTPKIVRQGLLVGENIGMLMLKNAHASYKYRPEENDDLLELLVDTSDDNLVLEYKS